ncbi:MAG TPA: hypothetical protein VHY82_04950 [Acetobacteraceae bacterium]|jgi:hypothetical protein|nr:hypothetical protein [Acetobacteraceae bacterium]
MELMPQCGGSPVGFGIGSAIYRPGDSPETVAAKVRRLVSALGR